MRRKEERQTVSRPASIEFGDGNVLQCRIANISRSGALLIVPNSESLPSFFHVVDMVLNERREVRKAWTGPNRAGVEYIDGENSNFGTPVRPRATFGKRPNRD